MLAFEAVEGSSEWPEPERFNQRLAREAQQSIEILRREPHHTFGRFVRPRGDRL